MHTRMAMARVLSMVFLASISIPVGCGAPAPEQAAKTAQPVEGLFRPRGANSQLPLPHNLVLGDFDMDGKTDFLQFWGDKLFVNHTDFNMTRVLSVDVGTNINRVITGDFYGDGSDHVCPIVTSGVTTCYGISPDHTALWWAFYQPTFVADNEDFIVADFNGDMKDDILVYPKGGGAYRMYTIASNGFFALMPSFNQGNLGSVTGTGYQLRAGDFNGDGRQDLAVVRPSGQLSYFFSVFDGTSDTFWWVFNTANGFVGGTDEVTIARIDDDRDDDVVLRNTSTGATRFYNMALAGSGLAPITGVSLGEIDTEANSSIFWGSMHDPSPSEPGSYNREDALVYVNTSNLFVRDEAHWDGSQLTYWWIYTQYPPTNVLQTTQSLGGGSVYASVAMTLDAYGQFSMTPTIENHDQATGYMYNLVCNIGPYAVGYQGHVGPASLFLINGPTRDTPGTKGVVSPGIGQNWATLVGLWQQGPGKSSGFGCQLDTSSTLQAEINQAEQTLLGVALQYFNLDPGSLAAMATCIASDPNEFVCGQGSDTCIVGGSSSQGAGLDCDPEFPDP